MKPLQRCFVFSTYEMRNYCIALILNRTLLVLVFIFGCQRSVDMSHGKRRNNDSQEKVSAKKRIICSYGPAWEEGYIVLPGNNNRHAFYTVSCVNRQYLVNTQVRREMLIVIMTQNFHKVHTIKMLSNCRLKTSVF